MDLPDNEKPKKDLIDLVREGHKIEIYEQTPLLKEGDVLKDWKSAGDNIFQRRLVGRAWVYRFFWYASNVPVNRCEFCDTPYHLIKVETRVDFVGRDKRTYSKYSSEESQYEGVICPKCGFETHYSPSYD